MSEIWMLFGLVALIGFFVWSLDKAEQQKKRREEREREAEAMDYVSRSEVDPSWKILEVLVELKRITPQQQMECLRESRARNIPPTDVALEKGIVTARDLETARKRQVILRGEDWDIGKEADARGWEADRAGRKALRKTQDVKNLKASIATTAENMSAAVRSITQDDDDDPEKTEIRDVLEPPPGSDRERRPPKR